MSFINQVKKYIQNECKKSKHIGYWFFEIHLLGVEKQAKILIKKLPKANKEVVMLGVWLHDLQRIRGIKGDHAKVGADEAEKVMKKFGYNEKLIKQVKDIILTHPCDGRVMPQSLEGKILSSADAMAHYTNDFFLKIALTGQRDLLEYKKWLKDKLDKNYNKKIFFPFAKKMIKDRHDVFKKLITMK